MPQESGYYPPGAEFDPKAPYNENDPKGPFEDRVLITEVYERLIDLPHDNIDDDLEEVYRTNEWTLFDLLHELQNYVINDDSKNYYYTSKILQAIEDYEPSNFSINECN